MSTGHLLSLNGVSIEYGGPPILDGVSMNISVGDRACITGRNGEGKSTLMKIIAGVIEPDAGEIIRAPGLRTAYLTQDVPGDRPGTVLEIAEENLFEDHEQHRAGASAYLSELGLDPAVEFNTLSGGMRRRVLLARALASAPQLLLLDEPTNHLDIESIEWLETYLRRNRTLACMFVTHDRAFLKHAAHQVYDLDRGKLSGWDCDYPTFLKRKAELLADEAVFWERKTKKLAEEEAWIRRGVKARTTRNEGRVAVLMKLREEFKARRGSVGKTSLRIDTAAASGDRVIKIEKLSFAYPGGRELVRDLTCDVLKGERIGVIGLNGAGKTTLLKLLCGRLQPTSGAITIGTRVEMAFFDQLREDLDPEASVMENVAKDRDEVVVGGVRKHIYSYLSDFLFTSERCRTPVKALSGGERARLLLAKLFLKPSNLLVMDEPTNDLDVETLELLEEQLLQYQGTLLLVSHDREFIDHVVTSTFVFEGAGDIGMFPGGYSDWLVQRKRGLGEKDVPKEEPKAETPRAVSENAPTPKKLSYKETRELAELPGKIEKLEAETKKMQDALTEGSIFRTDPKLAAEYSAKLPDLQVELEAAVERWAELEERA